MPVFPHCRACLIRFGFILIGASSLWSQPVINEFMASNTATLADDDGTYSDWIEIHNQGAHAVSLRGWALTDKAADPAKWRFPEVSLQPGEYRVVFCSRKDKSKEATAVARACRSNTRRRAWSCGSS